MRGERAPTWLENWIFIFYSSTWRKCTKLLNRKNSLFKRKSFVTNAFGGAFCVTLRVLHNTVHFAWHNTAVFAKCVCSVCKTSLYQRAFFLMLKQHIALSLVFSVAFVWGEECYSTLSSLMLKWYHNEVFRSIGWQFNSVKKCLRFMPAQR